MHQIKLILQVSWLRTSHCELELKVVTSLETFIFTEIQNNHLGVYITVATELKIIIFSLKYCLYEIGVLVLTIAFNFPTLLYPQKTSNHVF